MTTTTVPSLLLRQKVLGFPEDSPRGAVTRFCEDNGVSRAWFYKVRSRAKMEGLSQARTPRPRIARSIPGRTSPDMEQAAINIRLALKDAGWDYGPISVFDEMTRQGLTPPARATLARIFTRHHVVKPEPRKRPKSSYTRFCYPEPNGSWQLDGMNYTIDGDNSTWVILQVEDDHSRMIMGSSSAAGETSDAAIEVYTTAETRHGTPQRFHTDNSFGFNRDRWGWTTRFAAHLRRRGVEPITGRPGKPTTQGKQERLHQTLQRFLDAHQPIQNKTHLDQLLTDFEFYYNMIRNHQAHHPRRTPSEVYHASPKAPPPTPHPTHATSQPTDTIGVDRVVSPDGRLTACGCRIFIGRRYAGHTMYVLYNHHTITIIHATTGEILGDLPRPPTNQGTPPQVKMIPNRPRSSETELSTKV